MRIRLSTPILIILAIILAAGILVLVIAPRFSYAQVGSAFLPFGGRIIFSTPCTTPPGVLIKIGPPFSRSIVVQTPGTIIFLFGSFRPGALVLGTHAPVPIICFAGPLPAGAGFPAAIIGTSP